MKAKRQYWAPRVYRKPHPEGVFMPDRIRWASSSGPVWDDDGRSRTSGAPGWSGADYAFLHVLGCPSVLDSVEHAKGMLATIITVPGTVDGHPACLIVAKNVQLPVSTDVQKARAWRASVEAHFRREGAG